MGQEVQDVLAPWGARQTSPYVFAPPREWISVEVDPETQASRYLDAAGRRLDMGKHGTSISRPSQMATPGKDGKNPTPPDETTVTDYDTVPDND
jgi:putative ATP-grasp target RiPP